MKRSSTWLVIGIIAAVLVLATAYLLLRPGQPEPDTPPPVAPAASTEQPSTETAPTPGAYANYTAAALASAQGRRVLFFHAGWCPQCRAIEQDILAQGVQPGMTIFKVNYDTATDLKQKYGVTMQTTIVEIDSNGNIIKKHVAYNEPTLVAIMKVLEQ